MKYFWSALLALFTLVASAQADEPLSELRVQLPWIHQSQFTGLYVAQMRNHFKKEGLSVKLIEGGQVGAGGERIRKSTSKLSWKLRRGNGQNMLKNVPGVVPGFGGSVLKVG